MQLNASTLNDPALRPQLEQYYENKKNAAIAAQRAKEESMPQEPRPATITLPDGSTTTFTPKQMTADQMEKAFVSFDVWLDIMNQQFEFTATTMEMAEKNLTRIEELNPDRSSEVRATFSKGGVLYAYINSDGSLVTSNGAEKYLAGLEEIADRNGLTGQVRIDFLANETKRILTELHPELSVELYDEDSSPTLREFAQSWYHGYDADQIYADALAEAQASYDSAKERYTASQQNMYDIQSFLLKTQGATV